MFNLFEHEFEVLVANARHIKAGAGRKTAGKDAEWLADLLRQGLLRPSFIPARPHRELVRYRRRLQEKAQLASRMPQVLEGGNSKLASVASDILGVSGRAMLRAMSAGEEAAQRLAEVARGVLRKKRAALREALPRTLGAHHRFMLKTQLRLLATVEAEIAHLDAEGARRLPPLAETLKRLDTIPGGARRTAEDLLAEIGPAMVPFPSAAPLASWAKLSPGHYQRAGKRRSGFTGRGSPWLSATLPEVAQAATRTKDTSLAARDHRLARRRGRKRASIALAHAVRKIIYHLLREGTDYRDRGGTYYEQRDKRHILLRSVKRLERLGYRGTLQAA